MPVTEHLKLYLKVLSSEFKEGLILAQINRPRKLEAQQLFFLNFKGSPSQEEHKAIFSGLKINKMAMCG